jgi:hypothetical protein
MLQSQWIPSKISIVFCGTKSGEICDWIVNTYILDRKMQTANGLLVHAGMLGALEDTCGGGKPSAFDLIDQHLQHCNPLEVVLCGHSLGGGYAIITAAHLIAQGLHVSHVLQFGSPSTILTRQEPEARQLQSKLAQRTTAIVYRNDIVPRSLGRCLHRWTREHIPKFREQEQKDTSIWKAPIKWVFGKTGDVLLGQLLQHLKDIEARGDHVEHYRTTGRIVVFMSFKSVFVSTPGSAAHGDQLLGDLCTLSNLAQLTDDHSMSNYKTAAAFLFEQEWAAQNSGGGLFG